MTLKKWLTLSAVGAALLLIPRRSSRQLPTSDISKKQDTATINENKKSCSKEEQHDQ